MNKCSSQTPPSRGFKPYPKYKDSGAEVLGKIPVDWEVLKLKRVCTLAYGDSLAGDSRTEGNIEVYGSNGPVGTHDRANTLAPCLVIGRKGSFGKVNYSPNPVFAIDTTFFVDSRVTKADIRWLYYVLINARLDSTTKDSAIPGLDREDAYLFDIPACAAGMQHAIAAFLDRETAKIDALMEKKEKLIELLQEKRAALIAQAVTKGLDPTVPMKDSGIDWIGKIPAHWRAKRVKWAAKMESGHTPDKKIEAYWVDCNIPWISLNDTGYLKDHDYISDTAYMVNAVGLANSSARLLPEKAVVFSRDATVGLCAITTRPMAVSQHFIAWLCRPELKPEYLLYVFRSMTQELERLTMGATIMTIGMPDVKTLSTPIPPISEQEHIVQHIRTQSTQLDGLIARVHDAIDRLKEYRTALISAAVTGKIDVRGEVA